MIPRVIYVMGPPGAGKGTQAELLSQYVGYHRFSTGDAFRAMAREDSPLGRRVHEIIHGQGKLMPSEDAAAVVISAVKEHVKEGRGLIFDGTPRTIGEAAMVDEFFAEQGYGRPLVIRLMVDKEDMIARNSKRRFCLDIHNDFPVVTPADEERCGELGGRVGMREDDRPEKIDTRWQEFMEKTHPVLEKYTAEGIVHEVDGKGTVAEVQEAVRAVVDGYSRE